MSLPPVIDLGWGVGGFFASLLLWRLGQDVREAIKRRWFPDPDPPLEEDYRSALDKAPGDDR